MAQRTLEQQPQVRCSDTLRHGACEYGLGSLARGTHDRIAHAERRWVMAATGGLSTSMDRVAAAACACAS